MNSIRKISRRQALLSMGATLGMSLASRPWLLPGGADAVEKSDFSEIDRRLKEMIDTGVFEGIGLLLCTKDRTLYKKAFGADTTETPHLLASATKLASATTVMTLVHDKLVKLDDPIKKYLPQFGPVRWAITIRQLLAQTHGMPANHPCIPQPAQRRYSDQNTSAAMLLLLEKRGLIRRRTHTNDGRARCVYLTPKGRMHQEKLDTSAESLHRQLREALPAEEKDAVLNGLKRIADAVAPPDGRSWAVARRRSTAKYSRLSKVLGDQTERD